MNTIEILQQLALKKPVIAVFLSVLLVIGLIIHYTYKLALSNGNITYQFCAIAIVAIIASTYILYLLIKK